MRRARRSHQGHQRGRGLRPLLRRLWFVSKCLVFLAAAVGVVWGGHAVYRMALQSTYFRVRTVHIEGNQALSRRDVLYLLALPPEATLLQLDLTRMGTRLQHHPAVKTVTLRRQLPDRLIVTLHERTPALVVETPRQRMVLDTEGVVLRPYAASRDAALPRLRLGRRQVLAAGMHLQHDEVQQALALVRAYGATPVASRARLVGLTVEDSGHAVLRVAPYAFTIRLGMERIATQLGRLPPVLNYIEAHDLAVRRVDVSYRQRVFVTLETS